MNTELSTLLYQTTSVGGLLAYWHLIPQGVKKRLYESCSFLAGRVKRKADIIDRKEDAEIKNNEKREENKTTAEEKVFELLVPEIAKNISADPEKLERAIIGVMGEAYRKQENKESVAQECLKDMQKNYKDASDNPTSPDEDWLNIFSSYAEQASTERTRQLWGRILSGEVRHPGQFSLSTLRILLEIDKNTAEEFVKIAHLVFGDVILLTENYINENFQTLFYLQEYGLIKGVGSPLAMHMQNNKESKFFIIYDKDFFVNLTARSHTDVKIRAIFLSKPGKDLMSIIDFNKNKEEKLESIFESLKESFSVLSFDIYDTINIDNGNVTHDKTPKKSWRRQ